MAVSFFFRVRVADPPFSVAARFLSARTAVLPPHDLFVETASALLGKDQKPVLLLSVFAGCGFYTFSLLLLGF